MSESEKNVSSTTNSSPLPRVIYTKSKDKSWLKLNFGSSSDCGDKLSDQFKNLADEWTSFCISFFRVVPKFVGIGYAVAHGHMENSVVDFLVENAVAHEKVVTEDGDEESTFVVHEDDLLLVLQKLNRTRQSTLAAKSMERATLSSLISEYEYLMERLIFLMVEHKIESFLGGQETVEVGDLRDAESIEELRRRIVRRKIRNELRNKSHMEVLDWVRNNLEVNALPPDQLKKEFVEICQRRHLLMHAGGRVNDRYITSCMKAGWKREDLAEVGEELDVSERYLMRSTARVYQVGFYVLHMLWQGQGPNLAENSYSNLLSVSHDFLVHNLTEMARRVYDFAMFSEGNFDHRLKMCFRINRALCELFDKSLDEGEQTRRSKEILSDFDWSVTTPEFELALACCRREFDNILTLAEKAVGHVDYHSARTYCVYREARKIDGFLDIFPRSALALPMPDKQFE